MSASGAVERIWYGDDGLARVARASLTPGALLFAAAAAARNAMYDAGWLRAAPLPLPAISVGNITVGGTGKTPVAAFIAGILLERGGHPAVVLRGYGDDEPLVHRLLNPQVPVIVSPDRVEGTRRARDAGADLVVLDDAFQHRRAARQADVVLVSADRWRADMALLPAGPLREPPSALRRASLVVVTRKASSPEAASRVVDWVGREAPGVATAVAHLRPAGIVAWSSGERLSSTVLAGRAVFAIAAVGDPDAFVGQIRALGADASLTAFRDHHRYSATDAARLAAAVPAGALALCTLKDAVKLGPLWPAGGPTLWYVSQDVILERGQESLDATLRALVASRR